MEAVTNSFNPNYPVPSAEVQRKLRLSRLEAENIVTRDIRCPVCDFPVARIPASQKEIVFVKCHKCKFIGPLSPAHFRRLRRYHERLSDHHRRRMVR